MSELDDLVAAYKAGRHFMTEKQKAEAERAMWDAFCSTLPPGTARGCRRDWFKSTFGGTSYEYEHRQLMLDAGAWVEPFWEMFNSGVAHWTVFRLFHRARTIAAEKRIPYSDAARDVIQEYSESGYMAQSANGKIWRRRTPVRRSSRPEPAPDSSRSEPAPDSSRSEPAPDSSRPEPAPDSSRPEPAGFDAIPSQNSKSKRFTACLSALVDEYIKSSVADADPDEFLVLKLAADEFIGFVREAAEDMKRRVNSSRSAVKRNNRRPRVSRDRFRHACEVLNLPYKYGQAVDLRFCKKMMLKRAGPLHPDRNNGSHSAVAEYQAVIESYSVLEQYMEGLKSDENGDRSHGR